ncbi:tyrosine-type recombinase/integrase [Kitasatospora sp. NPDC059599]|uniref:tyrosine-type recombinase/integrase n=1 Tax=Kitasatospora sp. NPDC059599 TaxID=3346880 RepID=UPI0036D11D2B
MHPHRFRHTLGTQLAERGARVQTIMKVLGHKSPGMSMTYTHISDPTVLADYQAVLTPGAAIAGLLADTLRSGQLDQDALDWLKTNFYKTELELGRCLRLPQEGPCECDLYLSCAKFVTTPQYAPRLRERLCTERQLITDARDRGWEREIERPPAHRRPHHQPPRRPRRTARRARRVNGAAEKRTGQGALRRAGYGHALRLRGPRAASSCPPLRHARPALPQTRRQPRSHDLA